MYSFLITSPWQNHLWRTEQLRGRKHGQRHFLSRTRLLRLVAVPVRSLLPSPGFLQTQARTPSRLLISPKAHFYFSAAPLSEQVKFPFRADTQAALDRCYCGSQLQVSLGSRLHFQMKEQTVAGGTGGGGATVHLKSPGAFFFLRDQYPRFLPGLT